MSDRRDDIQINTGDLNVGERIVVDRDAEGRVRHIRKVRDDCWVVTAYYGDPVCAEVVSIRSLRSELIALPFLGRVVVGLNKAYFWLSTTRFGRRWSADLRRGTPTLARALTAPICRFLLWTTSLHPRRERPH